MALLIRTSVMSASRIRWRKMKTARYRVGDECVWPSLLLRYEQQRITEAHKQDTHLVRISSHIPCFAAFLAHVYTRAAALTPNAGLNAQPQAHLSTLHTAHTLSTAQSPLAHSLTHCPGAINSPFFAESCAQPPPSASPPDA